MRDISLKRLILLFALTNALTTASAQRFAILPHNTPWKYDIACADNTGWEQGGYNDTGWLSGAGGFTGGETSAAVLAVCNTRTLPAPNSGGRNGAAMYFRTHFSLPSVNDVSLVFSNAIDDAAVFYLNGIRIQDLRLTANPALCADFGGFAIGPNSDALLWEVFTLTPADLAGIIQPGDNVLAVSVHQSNGGSSDMVFACTLTGVITFGPRITDPTQPTNRTVQQCRDVTLTVQADAFPDPTYQWFHFGILIDPAFNGTAVTPSLTLSNANPNDGGEYFCHINNSAGSATSPSFYVNVTPDTTPPTPLRAIVNGDRTVVTVVFNEPVLPGDDIGGAEAEQYYQIREVANPANTFMPGGAVILYDTNVTLTLAPFTWIDGNRYELLVTGIADKCAFNVMNNPGPLPIITPFQQGPYYSGTDDTELRQGGNQGSNPQGTNVTITVDNSDGTPAGVSHALLRFRDLIGDGVNQVPPGATIKSAILTLHSTVNDAQSVNAISFYRMLVDWDEVAVTYNSLVDGVANDNVEAASVVTGAFVPDFPNPAVAGVQSRSVDLTADVQMWADGRPNYGWAFRSDGIDGYRFDSSENTIAANRPELVVDFDPPQPNQAPTILKHPATIIVCTNEAVTFSLTANGTRPLYYQWRKNGANIRGANSPTLVISNVQVADGGGYSVLVANALGVTGSTNALLCLCTNSVPFLAAADDFADRVGLPQFLAGVVQGDNILATKEPGEPDHVGEADGKSAWYTWRAPASGIATFSTRGSTFDTLLAIYVGSSVSNLVRAGRSDDKRPIGGDLVTGWFFTSEAKFNVSAEVDYHVVIDGYSCYDGKIVLSWDLEQTADVIPTIIAHPAGATVARGDTDRFSVVALSANSYQWFRHGAPIAGATGSTLTITNVQPEDVGDYRVDVLSPQNRRMESDIATLEIGSFPSMRSRDKIILQSCQTNHQPRFVNGDSFMISSISIPALLVGAGGFQIINNTNSTVQWLEPPHCESVGNASRWLTVTNRDVGILVVHTSGSAIPAVLAAYTNRSGEFFPDIRANLDCAEGNLSDGVGSYIRFHARRDGAQDGKHWIVVDGAVNFSAANPFREGVVQLHYVLCPIGRIFPTNQSLTVTQGSHVVFCSGISPSQTLQRMFQWFRNDVPIPGAVTDVWILPNVGLGDSGVYSVRVDGFEVEGPFVQVLPLLDLGIPERTGTVQDPQVILRGTARVPAGVSFKVEGSPDFLNWFGLFTNRGPRLFNFTNFPPPAERFYRGVVP